MKNERNGNYEYPFQTDAVFRHERGIFDEVDEDETKKIKTQNTFSSEWDGWELAFILFAMKANET